MKKLTLPLVTSIGLLIILFFAQAIALDLVDNNISTEIIFLIEKEPDIPSHQININTDDRVVTLDGKVETRLQANKIVELANSVEHVKHVDPSKLKIVSSKQYIKDAYITAATKGKILRLTNLGKIGKGHELQIETTNGRIHVFGSLENNTDLDILTKELFDIKGVKDVKFNIKIK